MDCEYAAQRDCFGRILNFAAFLIGRFKFWEEMLNIERGEERKGEQQKQCNVEFGWNEILQSC